MSNPEHKRVIPGFTIMHRIDYLWVLTPGITNIFNTEYNEEFIKITIYLITLKKLKDISALEFHRFKREALKYGVYKRKL